MAKKIKNHLFIKKENFIDFKEKNLQIRWLLCDLMPFLDETTLKRYREFFKYSENLDRNLMCED